MQSLPARQAMPEPISDPKPQWLGVSQSDCNKMLQHALKRDPTVKFMVEKMKEVQLLLLSGNKVRMVLKVCSHSRSPASCLLVLAWSFMSKWQFALLPVLLTC